MSLRRRCGSPTEGLRGRSIRPTRSRSPAGLARSGRGCCARGTTAEGENLPDQQEPAPCCPGTRWPRHAGRGTSPGGGRCRGLGADTSAAGVPRRRRRGGRVLARGQPRALRRADGSRSSRAGLVKAGDRPNGISLALEAGGLTHATAGEHYVRAHHGWTCTASPIRDRRGRIVGVLDVSHPLRFSSVQTAALVRCGARLAESLLAALPSPHDGLDPRDPRDHDDDATAPSTHARGGTPDGRSNPVTEIRLLGWKPAVIRSDGTSIALSPRRAELLALLASGRRGRRGRCRKRSTRTVGRHRPRRGAAPAALGLSISRSPTRCARATVRAWASAGRGARRTAARLGDLAITTCVTDLS